MDCEEDGILLFSASSKEESEEELLISAKNNNLEVGLDEGKTCSGATHEGKTGRKKLKETDHPVYSGVRKRKGRKWVSEVMEPNDKKSRIWLGTFPTPEMAARAYDVASAKLTLRSGGDENSVAAAGAISFADSSSLLPRPRSSSAADIRIAAFLAAEAFGQQTTTSQDIRQPQPLINTSSSSSWSRMFVDEEEMFNMPVLINSMAEGLLLTPPAMKKGFHWNDIDEDDDFEFITSLWKDN